MHTPQAVRTLAALAHDARLAVFKLLVQAGPVGLAAGVIAQSLAVAPSALSFHLKELTQAGLLTALPDGRLIRYAARFDTMNALIVHLTENCCRGEPCVLVAIASPCEHMQPANCAESFPQRPQQGNQHEQQSL